MDLQLVNDTSYSDVTIWVMTMSHQWMQTIISNHIPLALLKAKIQAISSNTHQLATVYQTAPFQTRHI